MLTALEVIRRTEGFFEQKGLSRPRLEAELIIGHILGLKRLELYLQFDRPLTEDELAAMRPLVRRRAAREPLQYVLGEAAFADLILKVDRRALIPRPETEELLELGIAACAGEPAAVLDLGTGSGALALALAKRFPGARVTAVDADPQALDLARENAAALELVPRVRFLESDWFSALPEEERFDLIVANPPYLTEAEIVSAQPEVANHEPRHALIAGPDGLDCLRVILARLPDRLARGGLAVLETGIAQHPALEALCRDLGLKVEGRPDLSDRPRFVLVRA